MTGLEMVSVASMHVLCSYQVRNIGQPGLAVSDTCRDPADSVVVVPGGAKMFRCPSHRGQCWPGETGAVEFELPRLPSP